ncbi:hypothetical protein GCK72_021453 [Caenorhabditis remanei]|uniref:F-box domain-containing protein n=1 Tax=Caenorhabditis remanei TaxID=31234 RepID=A0A6A5GI69_CAERE|nr:hypothetical protein GCK72_021453 [Caenorhabditis remanei]KAF1754888.1 hypothetical protein GCK72_021453 [Caenorhabditis remanei]
MSYLKWYKSEETPPPLPSQRVHILDMPDLVMRKILDEIDLVSIMKLRKVCRAFRNYIDDTKPDSKLNGLEIYKESNSIFVSYWYFLSKPLRKKKSKEVTVSYENNKKGCEIRFGEGQLKHINGRKTFDVFCEDMQMVLGNQKTTIRYFNFHNCEDASNSEEEETHPPNLFQKSLELFCCRRRSENTKTYPSQYANSIPMYNTVFDFILEILKSRNLPVQVSNLRISVNGQDQLETLLKHVKSTELKYLVISEAIRASHADMKCELNLDVLKNFGNLNELTVYEFLISSSLESLSHIPTIEGTFKKITATEILARKETHLELVSLFDSWVRCYTIKYDEFPDKSRLFELFGAPIEHYSSWTKWKFNIPKTKKKLVVSLWASSVDISMSYY